MQRTSSADWATHKAPQPDYVDAVVRHRIRECPYAYMFNGVDWQFDRGTLRLEGSVQSFYLKQILQELLRGVEHVDQIINRVDVVRPTGLSSVRPPQHGK